MNNSGSVDSSEIKEENNYYPFGLEHKGYNNEIAIGTRDHKYGFGGKEEQDELGLDWIDITARNYDPALGRWMNIDPLAEQMRRHSPYNYAFDNPIYWTDPDGMAPQSSNDWVYKDGGYYWDENINSADQVPEGSDIEYVGENRSDVDTHYDNRGTWDAFKTGGKNVDEKSYENYKKKIFEKNIVKAINNKDKGTQIYLYDGVRGMDHDSTFSSGQEGYGSTSGSKTENRENHYSLDINGETLTADRSVVQNNGDDVSPRDTFTIRSVTKTTNMAKGELSKGPFPISIRLYGVGREKGINTTANVILRFSPKKLKQFNAINLPPE
jgi:RHS repeat-associated protein